MRLSVNVCAVISVLFVYCFYVYLVVYFFVFRTDHELICWFVADSYVLFNAPGHCTYHKLRGGLSAQNIFNVYFLYIFFCSSSSFLFLPWRRLLIFEVWFLKSLYLRLTKNLKIRQSDKSFEPIYITILCIYMSKLACKINILSSFSKMRTYLYY